ncbi:hypothetical protein VXR13_18920 [Acinetobacter baumannii]|uniref:hypothetical protein n=1 Tax=Acinetobacter baumannii TaxID=470 RepID=UPI003A86DB3E
MDNYKIKVKDEAESKEAQELLKQLGFQEEGFTDLGLPCYLATWDGGYADYYIDSLSEGRKREELTLPQLRDLVVLKRNDVKDATHRDKRDESIYLTSDKVIYYWQGEWCKSAINKSNDYENYIANSLTPIAQPQDPALISGADALRALADGKEVEANNSDFGYWIDARNLGVKDFFDDIHIFRLKPQTIKLELELPKPFEPKVGDIYWFLSPFYSTGYDHCTFTNDSSDKLHVQYGAYRTEEDVKKAVEQLRKIRGTNS